uniref:Uncharacterized protein n=1 Tax=Molossus molossus TaxID=27622 RepID=A0A7J8FRQ5_MOLMO|nr:hypothetical protein HJG59_008318 [Molossus molossus]
MGQGALLHGKTCRSFPPLIRTRVLPFFTQGVSSNFCGRFSSKARSLRSSSVWDLAKSSLQKLALKSSLLKNALSSKYLFLVKGSFLSSLTVRGPVTGFHPKDMMQQRPQMGLPSPTLSSSKKRHNITCPSSQISDEALSSSMNGSC